MHAFPDQYNPVWTSMSRNSGESMPCGGHDIGLNVWVEPDAAGKGDLLFYIDRAGSFDENNQMLKLGRVRVRLTPNPFRPGMPFRQELKLRQGYIEITAGEPAVTIAVWVEVAQPVIHVEVAASHAVTLEVQYENWRQAARTIPYERRHPCASWVSYPGTVTTEPDNVAFAGDAVRFYHRNRSDRLLYDFLVKQQGLEPVKCETYKDALNPADLVAGLQGTAEALLEIASDLLREESLAYYRGLLERIPPLPFRELQGHKTIAPAVSWTGIINVEIPQLYPVHPYELYGLTKADLQVAIDTWRYGDYTADQLSHVSWHQQAIFCARMGLAEDAARYTLLKLADSGRRFPAFWGPSHDWTPDHNWGGSGMIGLQEMLMQCFGRQILLLLPAWPADWNVEFRLHAHDNTIVEGSYAAGRLEYTVTPPERATDVVVMHRQSSE